MEQIIHNNGKIKLTQWGKNFHIFAPSVAEKEPVRTATILSTGYIRFYLTGVVQKVDSLENFDARTYAEKMYTAACERLGVPT